MIYLFILFLYLCDYCIIIHITIINIFFSGLKISIKDRIWLRIVNFYMKHIL